MRFQEARPFVRFAQSFSPSPSSCGHYVVARDSRVFILRSHESTISVRTDPERTYHLLPGSGVFIPAGTHYRISDPGNHPPEFLIINFDFDQAHAQATMPLPVLEPKDAAGNAADIFYVPVWENENLFSDPLDFTITPSLEGKLMEIVEEYTSPRRYSQTHMGVLMQSVLIQIARLEMIDSPAQPLAIDTMIEVIRNRYAYPLSNSEIAQSVNYHPNYANTLFLRHTGQTLRQYLIEYRIQKALELLLSTDQSLTDIALKTGFPTLSSFSREFRLRTGNLPSAYRREKRLRIAGAETETSQ